MKKASYVGPVEAPNGRLWYVRRAAKVPYLAARCGTDPKRSVSGKCNSIADGMLAFVARGSINAGKL